jgi:hypothetical protein
MSFKEISTPMNVSLSSALNASSKFGNIYSLTSSEYGLPNHPVSLTGDNRLLAYKVGEYLHPGTPAEESGHGDVWQTLSYPRGNTILLDGQELKDYKKVNSDLARIRETSNDPMVKQAVFIAELQHDMAVAKAATPLDVTAIQEHPDQFPIQPPPSTASQASTQSPAPMANTIQEGQLPPANPAMPMFTPAQLTGSSAGAQPNPFAQATGNGGLSAAAQ